MSFFFESIFIEFNSAYNPTSSNSIDYPLNSGCLYAGVPLFSKLENSLKNIQICNMIKKRPSVVGLYIA